MAAPMENMLTNLFQLYSQKNANTINQKSFLSTLNHNQLISLKTDDSSSDLISYIHSCLSTNKNRVEGLLLLDNVVRQSTTSVFQQHALTWVKLLLKILQGHSSVPVFSGCCQMLALVFSHARSFSDVSREIVTSVIPQLLPLLIAAPAKSQKSAVRCINTCICNFPGPVGPFKTKIQALVLQELEDNCQYQDLYRCYGLLAQCGPGGTQGIKHTEAWSEQCTSLLASLHDTITQLYGDLGDTFHFEGKSLNLSTIEYGQSDRVVSLVSRWTSLTNCLVCLLSEEFSPMAKVPVDDILQLVYRCLGVNVNMLLSRPTSERCLLASFIQDLHVQALVLLQQLIVLCKVNLILQGSVIVSVLTRELVWTHVTNTGHDQPYGYLRCKVYEVLEVWMKSLDGSSGIVKEEPTLVKELLHDCLPYINTLQLQSDSAGTQDSISSAGTKKKKKKAGYQEISHGISTQKKLHPLANSDLVTMALDVLYWLMMTVGSEMSKKSIQEMQEFVVVTLVSVQQSDPIPVPYSSAACRRGLYRALLACVITPHVSATSPLQCALGIFSTGLLDKHTKVSSYCIEAMRMCETFIHPRVPCLNGPVVCETIIRINANVLEGSNNQMEGSGNLQTNTSQKAAANSSLGKAIDVDVDDIVNADDDEVAITAVVYNKSQSRTAGQEKSKDVNRDTQTNGDTMHPYGAKKSSGEGSNNAKRKRINDNEELVGTGSENDGLEKRMKKMPILTKESEEDDSEYEVEIVEGEEEDENDSNEVDESDNDIVEDMTDNKRLKSEDGDSTGAGKDDSKKRGSVIDVSSDEDDDNLGQAASHKQDGEEKPNPDIEMMVSAFVDAGPDSD